MVRKKKLRHQICCYFMAGTEERCEDCIRVVKKYRITTEQPHAFSVHVNPSLFETVKKEDQGKTKKEKEIKEETLIRSQEKKIVLDKLSAIACALRNTKGGSILVHLWGQKKENRYLGYLDEFFTDAFTYLIEDGKLYAYTYRRFWLDKHRKFKSEEGFVCINVNKSCGVSILDFCSKIRNDFEITKPSPLNILTYLKSLAVSEENRTPPEDESSTEETSAKTSETGDKGPEKESKEENSRQTTENKPKVRGIKVSELQENRTVELKSVAHCKQITRHTNVSDFIEFLWNDLKLKHNIVSMTKIEGGGSYYIGIAEKSSDGKRCSVKPELEGFAICTDKEEYIAEIQRKLSSEILVLKKDLTFADAPEDLITVTFHPHNSNFILEISIRKFDGLVFCDKEGPLAYVIQNGDIERLSKEEVLQRALRAYKLKEQY